MTHKVTQFTIFAAILAVNVAFAASAPTQGSSDNSAVFMWIIGGLCTLLFSISAFVLSKVDRNQNRLFELHDEMRVEQAKDRERLVKVETTQENCGNCP